MVIKNNNETFEIIVTPSNNNLGLRENDYWCNIEFNIDNDEIQYHTKSKSLSKNEIVEIIQKIDELLNRKDKYNEKMLPVKSFLNIHFINNKEKTIEIKLLKIDESKRNYTIRLSNDDIEKLFNYLNNLDFIETK